MASELGIYFVSEKPSLHNISWGIISSVHPHQHLHRHLSGNGVTPVYWSLREVQKQSTYQSHSYDTSTLSSQTRGFPIFRPITEQPLPSTSSACTETRSCRTQLGEFVHITDSLFKTLLIHHAEAIIESQSQVDPFHFLDQQHPIVEKKGQRKIISSSFQCATLRT